MSGEFPPVRELVPQRPPMLLLDSVSAWDGETLVCAACVRDEWLLVEGDAMPAAGLLEVMAQAVAALHGLQGRARGEPVRVGLLMGCRGLALNVPWVAVGAALQVFARQAHAIDAVAEFTCRVLDPGGRCLAEGELHVVRGELVAEPGAETESSSP